MPHLSYQPGQFREEPPPINPDCASTAPPPRLRASACKKAVSRPRIDPTRDRLRPRNPEQQNLGYTKDPIRALAPSSAAPREITPRIAVREK